MLSGAATVNTAYVLTAASFAVILSRTLLRRLRREKFQPDDYLMLAAMLLYAMNTAVYPVVVKNGNNTSVKDPSKLSPEKVRHIVLGSKFVLLGRPFYMSYVWSMKACILIYYTRLTSRLHELLFVKIAALVLSVTWAACILAIFLDCRPTELYWQVLPHTPNCARAIDFVIVMGSTNIGTDLMIMVIPLPIIFRAKLPLRRKIEISAIFLVGTFVVFVSIMRMVIVLASLTQQNKLMWGQLECFSATIVANGPILHGLYRHGCTHMRFSNRPTTNETSLPVSTERKRTQGLVITPRTATTDVESGSSGGFTEGSYTMSRLSRTGNNWKKLGEESMWQDSHRLDIERQIGIWQESNTESQHKEPDTGLVRPSFSAGLGLGDRDTVATNSEIPHGVVKETKY